MAAHSLEHGGRPPAVAGRVEELVAGVRERVTIRPGDGKSGSAFERVEIGGERYLLKTVSYAGDWIMRMMGDRDYRTFRLWRSGLMHRTPPWIDHTVVAMALEGTGPEALLGVLMRDVGELLLPEGDSVVELRLHRRFVDHLAGLCTAFWGWRDELGLTTMPERFRFVAPDNIAAELARPDTDRVVLAADQGWAALRRRAPELADLAGRVHARPGPLTDALARTPSSFLHGDWKMGNLGSHPDGRTILLDWAYPGAGPPCWDLAWYLALNRARLPESKEDTIEAFRGSLRRHGVDPDGWFDVQMGLCQLAIMATFGWEKALGDQPELGWWVERAQEGARLLDDLEPGWR